MAADLKPVAWRYRRDADMSWALCQSEVIAADWSKHGWDVEPLYAAVPAPLASAGTAGDRKTDFASSEMVAGPPGPRTECPQIGGGTRNYQWYWRTRDGEADCGIFYEERPGHAYSVCRAPRYAKEAEWSEFARTVCGLLNGPGTNARTLSEGTQRSAAIDAAPTEAAAEGVDESRAEFEAWAYREFFKGHPLDFALTTMKGGNYLREKGGKLESNWWNDRLTVWQAARASHRPRSGSSVAVASSGNATQCPTLGGEPE